MAPTYEPERDYYKLLGLTAVAATDTQVIRAAYLKCAREAHPDRDRTNEAATGNFQDIQEAYETLKDVSKRARYDKARLDALRKEDVRKREEAKRKDEEAWGRTARNRRRPGPTAHQHFQQHGQEKYFPYDRRAPKAPTTPKPPPGAASAWEELKRPKGAGKFGQSAPQSQPQKPAASNVPPRPGAHPTSKTPKKAPSQRPGSFAQWAKERPTTPETPGKNGYRPTSSTTGDEPRAKSSSYYSSTKKTDPFQGAHDSWETDSDNVDQGFKPRSSQPYQNAHRENMKEFSGRSGSSEEESRGRKPPSSTATSTPKKDASSAGAQSFWPHPESTPGFSNGKRSESLNPPPERPPFERTPTGSSASWFTAEPSPRGFTFTAGSETSDPIPVRKTRSSGHLGRKNTASPAKKRRPGPAEGFVPPEAPAPESPSLKFDPKEWSETFGPQTFIPKATQAPSVSPTRPTRSATLKKPATSRPPASTPQRPIVIEDSSSDEGGRPSFRGNPLKPTSADHAPSPNAMDIDSPPPRPSAAATPAPAPAPAPTPTRAGPARTRDVPVEPSKPEWRAGTGGVQFTGPPKAAATPAPTPGPAPSKPAAGGSEDTDEFRATLNDLKNVPPFAPQGSGLASLGDLKTSLPFSSQSSERVILKEKKRHPALDVPKAPTAPVFPAAIGANGIRPTREILQIYMRAFESYQVQWCTYNGIIMNHFNERQKRTSEMAAAAAAATTAAGLGPGGLEMGAVKQRVREQLEWTRQDAGVRASWGLACDEHAKKVQEYMDVLEKMTIT
ncbi:uncharacterized protein DNG_02514 [Cephalotrichum gorgonifer]|uniref:J domain-containing protein n=1 Tax=Cephalotrichum gorgonifer TaxID=2041049 RepID=A0AAE8MSJ7_9PEZI|nr:uncharacterized protein DNG_02514 [Cephalotrichum gorgonifer]